MSTIDVVIGSNFGDEGKGLMTDYLAHKYEGETVIVTRFNGGAQAGHTVQTPGNQRHVFSHFGAGLLAGAKTYLSEYFISNPILFLKEKNILEDKGVDTSEVYVHPHCKITTPYDMIINQGLERKRGDKRHGSCGSGINETMVRHLAVPLHHVDLRSPYFIDKVFEIRQYAKYRAQTMELDTETINLILSTKVFNQFISDCMEYKKSIIDDDGTILHDFEHVIFEGAQGLLLDEDHAYFPHVTHSKTGMSNVDDIIMKLKLQTLDTNIYYMSRGYMTRHGAGPFTTESKHIPYDIVDETNVHNEWQQSLRLGYLDISLLFETITEDMNSSYYSGAGNHINVVLTCMDHLPDTIQICNAGIYVDVTKAQLYKMVQTEFTNVYISEGPTRKTIKKVF